MQRKMLHSGKSLPLRLLFASVQSKNNNNNIDNVRHFMGWLNNIFNKVDSSRIADVGPDRACAEWLLRCGASVRWKDSPAPIADYNALPVGGYRRYKVEEVDATDSAIMEEGFPHFQGLTELRKLKLRNCKYITDESLQVLVSLTKDQLTDLEVSQIGSVSDEGVASLARMRRLSRLRLEELRGVRDPEGTLARIAEKLNPAGAGCRIEWPPYTPETTTTTEDESGP